MNVKEKKNSTFRSLTVSIVSMFISAILLVGTTYAWWTSSATTGTNIIKSGNFNISMQFSPTGADGTYTDISNGSSQLFLVSDRWEPGTIITRYIKIVNTSDMEIDTVLSIQKSDISGDLLDGLTISVDGGAFEPLADKFVGTDFTQIGTATIPGTGTDKEHTFLITIKLDDSWAGTGGTVQFFLKTLATKAGT